MTSRYATRDAGTGLKTVVLQLDLLASSDWTANEKLPKPRSAGTGLVGIVGGRPVPAVGPELMETVGIGWG